MQWHTSMGHFLIRRSRKCYLQHFGVVLSSFKRITEVTVVYYSDYHYIHNSVCKQEKYIFRDYQIKCRRGYAPAYYATEKKYCRFAFMVSLTLSSHDTIPFPIEKKESKNASLRKPNCNRKHVRQCTLRSSALATNK